MFFSITLTSKSATPVKMPYTSLDCIDSLPDLGDLLRELFNPLDVERHGEDAALDEDEEFGEDVLYDEEPLDVKEAAGPCEKCGPWVCEDFGVAGVQRFLLEDMLQFSEYYELSSEDEIHIRVCQLRYLSAVLRAGGDS